MHSFDQNIDHMKAFALLAFLIAGCTGLYQKSMYNNDECARETVNSIFSERNFCFKERYNIGQCYHVSDCYIYIPIFLSFFCLKTRFHLISGSTNNTTVCSVLFQTLLKELYLIFLYNRYYCIYLVYIYILSLVLKLCSGLFFYFSLLNWYFIPEPCLFQPIT